MNTKLKCILLDDELPGLTYLRLLCEQIEEVEIVKAYNNPMKFLEDRNILDFDLCILDIEMPGLSGLDVARLLKGKPVIFTTAYKEYAAEAFDLDAVDYIRKPIQKERLEKAIQKAAGQFNAGKTEKQYIQINTHKGKALVFFDQILHITTAETDKRDKVILMMNTDRLILKNITFEKLLSILPESLFCRINKKDILSMNTVRFFNHDEIITNIEKAHGVPLSLPLSDAYREEFLQKIKK